MYLNKLSPVDSVRFHHFENLTNKTYNLKSKISVLRGRY